MTLTQITQVLDDHTPNLTTIDDLEITGMMQAEWGTLDVAGLAIRTCTCGASIDGFYEYVDHLKAMFEDATK